MRAKRRLDPLGELLGMRANVVVHSGGIATENCPCIFVQQVKGIDGPCMCGSVEKIRIQFVSAEISGQLTPASYQSQNNLLSVVFQMAESQSKEG